MKCIAILVFFLGVFTRLGAEEVKLYGFGTHVTKPAAHFNISFHIPREELEKIPVWKPTLGQPAPLTRVKAVEIAKTAAISQGLAVPDDPRIQVILTTIHSNYNPETKTRPIRGCVWFYAAEFIDAKVDQPGKNTFVVTMSGALASREIK